MMKKFVVQKDIIFKGYLNSFDCNFPIYGLYSYKVKVQVYQVKIWTIGMPFAFRIFIYRLIFNNIVLIRATL